MNSEFDNGRNPEDDNNYITKVFAECGRYYAGIEELRQPAIQRSDAKLEDIKGDYAELYGLVDNLRDRFYARIPGMSSDVAMPPFELFLCDRRQAIEQLKLLPLHEFGVMVDETFPLHYAERWYERTVGAVVWKDEFHGDSCQIITRRDAPMSCRHSDKCPRKFLRHSLAAPALLADSEDIMYMIDPSRQRQLVEMKLNIAVKSGIEDRMIAFALLGEYDSRTGQ